MAPTDGEFARAGCVAVAADDEAVELGPVVGHAPKAVDARDPVRRRVGGLPGDVDVL